MTPPRPLWACLFSGQILVMVIATLLAVTNHLPPFLNSFPYMDKVLHFLLYGGLSFFAVGLFRRARWSRIVLLIAVLAAIEELSQGFFPNRNLDPYDLIANLAGILTFGLVAARLVQHDRSGTPAIASVRPERSSVP